MTKHFAAITCPELALGKYKREYLISPLLVAMEPCIVAGGKKQLKTSMMLDAGISLATQSPFLGCFTVSRSLKVGMMSGESGPATLQETARRIAETKGFFLADIANLIFAATVPRIEVQEHLDGLREFIGQHRLELLILDPAYMCMPGDEAGNLFKQGRLLGTVTELCSEMKCTLILVHHTKRPYGNPFRPPELGDIAWAGFQEWARQWWLINRTRPYEPGSGIHDIWLNAGGSAGHSGLWQVGIEEGICDGVSRRIWKPNVSLTRGDGYVR